MKLEKAIETSEMEQRRNYTERGNPIYEAHQLGIEALKRMEHDRMFHKYHNLAPLPGETVD